MRVNYETDGNGRLESVTVYPLNAAKPLLELPDEFDLKRIRDYVVKDGMFVHDPLPSEPTKAERITALKEKLAATDYAVIKIAEGAATADEYADVIAQRAIWRQQINELEE